MSLLFQGSTCRKVAETSMNQCSSRSHSVFTLYLTSKSPGKEVITRSVCHASSYIRIGPTPSILTFIVSSPYKV